MSYYSERLKFLMEDHKDFVDQHNGIDDTWNNGVYERFLNPVLTRDHIPLFWKYDLNPDTNPYLMERLGINATLNSGAIYLDGKYYLCARVEGNDRKSFFAIAESDSPTEGFKFWDYPCVIPQTDDPETNVYDMRLTKHEDGWIYGLFCAERLDPNNAKGDLSTAVASCGICRTKDLKTWERLPDLICPSQQRNVVLHETFINGKYGLYTRPQDGFIDTGSGGGICWALVDSMEDARIDKGQEIVIDERLYHTIKEIKNGQGAPPIKTEKGWLHVAHGVRGCASGLRYVIYAFLTDLKEPWKLIAAPSGHLISPMAWERVGDVSNVTFTNGMIVNEKEELYIYFASSDTRLHVARTTIDKMLDYVFGTPADPLNSYECVQQRMELIANNLDYLQKINLDKEKLR